jgi:hypothetical protein
MPMEPTLMSPVLAKLHMESAGVVVQMGRGRNLCTDEEELHARVAHGPVQRACRLSPIPLPQRAHTGTLILCLRWRRGHPRPGSTPRSSSGSTQSPRPQRSMRHMRSGRCNVGSRRTLEGGRGLMSAHACVLACTYV